MEEQASGVVIPKETVAASKEKKRRQRTTEQLQVWRDASNLKYLVVTLMKDAPKKLIKFYDQLLLTVGEIKKSIVLADISRDVETRTWYQDCARTLVMDAEGDLLILKNLNLLDAHRHKQMKSLAKGLKAQLIAWRDYTRNEGAMRDGLQTKEEVS